MITVDPAGMLGASSEPTLLRRQIALLQRYLRIAGARDARGHVPHVTGSLDARTVEAYNNVRYVQGAPQATASEILLDPEAAAVNVALLPGFPEA